MVAAPIATILFGVPVLLYIFVALAIPAFFTEGWDIAIASITFSSTVQDGNIHLVNTTTGIDGTVNNVTVNNLMNINVSLSRWDLLLEQCTKPGLFILFTTFFI